MEIVLVRHAQPGWTADDAAVHDPGLTELGRVQAKAVAERLASLDGSSRLLVSTATRSRQTAQPIIAATGLEPEIHDWLHELRFPSSWEGTPTEEVARIWRENRARPMEQWWEGVEGGETFRRFHRRVTEGFESYLEGLDVRRCSDDPDHLWEVPDEAPRLIVVAHAGTNSVVLGHLLGLQAVPWEWERFHSAHASVTLLRTTRIATAGIFQLRLFSGAGHLGEDQVTY